MHLPLEQSQAANLVLNGAILGAFNALAAHLLPRYRRHVLSAVLLVAALAYVHFTLAAGAGPVWLLVEVLGVLAYGVAAWRGLRGSAWWLAAGWALHPVWDIALHYAGPGAAIAPTWWTVPCLGWDLVVAGYIAVLTLGARRAGMAPQHRAAFDREVALARSLMARRQDAQAFRHLERAHVLGQQHVLPHVLTHWLMLRVAVRQSEPVAALGQAVRIVLGVLGSAVGRLPVGNTGGSNVSMFAPMPIPPELAALMQPAAPARREGGES
jgi:hypothetical protein